MEVVKVTLPKDDRDSSKEEGTHNSCDSEHFSITLLGREISAQARQKLPEGPKEVFLEKGPVFDLFDKDNLTNHRIYRIMDKHLEKSKISLEEAFIFEGLKILQ